ncbi:metallophosphoesterase, partial [Alistipes sp. OttesenSCG-928-L06]|nr:metallophosphoesterase [Alistipes sp. OttesenSCG-928-L06]
MKNMIFVMLAVILGANFYVFFRLWHLIPAGSVLRPILVVFGVMAVSSMFVAVLTAGKLPSAMTSFLYVL